MTLNCTPKPRSRSDKEPEQAAQVIYSSRDDSGTETWSGTFIPKARAISDWVTPQYEQCIAAGHIINNPCQMSVVEQFSTDSTNLYFDHNTSNFWFAYSGDYTRMFVNANGVPISDEASAMLRDTTDYSKVRAIAQLDNTPYAFGEDAFEVRETLRFLRRPFRSIADLARSFRKSVDGKTGSGISRSQALASTWLQYRFAFSPLVRSCQDAIEAATEKDPTLPERRTAHGFDDADYGTVSWSTLFGTANDGHTVSSEMSRKLSRHAVILYTVTNPLYDNWWRLGLRKKDIPYVLWQIMPYSFMVDRMADFSTAISAFTNILDPAVKILAGSHRTKSDVGLTHQVTDRTKTNYTVSGHGEAITTNTFSYSRVRWTPSLSDITPPINTWGLVEDATKIVDLIALIRNLLR